VSKCCSHIKKSNNRITNINSIQKGKSIRLNKPILKFWASNAAPIASKGKANENNLKVKTFKKLTDQLVIHRRALLLVTILRGNIYSVAAKTKNSPKNIDKRIIPSCSISSPLQNS
jgi:hypothetical protein